MATEQRDVKVTLDVTTGPSGDRALKALEKSVRDLAAAQGTLAGAAGGGPTGGPVRGMGTAGGFGGRMGWSAGNLQGMGEGMLSRFAAPAAIAHMATSGIASAAESYATPYMTTDQAERKFFRDVVPMGQSVQQFIDNVSGRSFKLAKAAEDHQKRMQDVQSRARSLEFSVRFETEQEGRRVRANVTGSAAPVLLRDESGRTAANGVIDRSTGVGERTFREESRLLPIRRDAAKLEREAAVASAERRSSEEQLRRLQAEQNNLLNRRLALQQDSNRLTGVERQKTLQRMNETDAEITNVAGQLQTQGESVFQRRSREAQARAAAAQQQAALKEAEAANAEERAATSAGTARKLGGMNVFDRQFAVQSVKAVQKYGPGRVSPEMLSAAQGIAPETIGKQLEARGASTPAARELEKIAPADYAGDPEKLRKEAQGLRNQAESMRIQNEAVLARALADAGSDFGTFVAKQINVAFEAAKRKIETDLRIGLEK